MLHAHRAALVVAQLDAGSGRRIVELIATTIR